MLSRIRAKAEAGTRLDRADGVWLRVGVPLLDLGSGLWAALGCVAALHRRYVTGVGGMVDTSLLETALGWLGGRVPWSSRSTRSAVAR